MPTTPPRIWCLHYDSAHKQRRWDAMDRGQFQLLNDAECTEAIQAFSASLPGEPPWPDALPADFPHPRFRMPVDEPFAPDFFAWGKYEIVSQRLRQAMDLPDWAVSYVPVDLEAGSAAAYAQDYAMLYVRAFADAIDLDASQARYSHAISRRTGAPYISVDWLDRIRFKPDLRPPADLFADTKAQTRIFATDPLAERVLRAGCTGLQFVHPLWRAEGDGSYVIRTEDGIGRILWDEEGQHCEVVPFDPAEADAGPRSAVFLSLG